MKHILSLILIIFLAHPFRAQDPYRTKKQFFLGVFASPDLSFTTNTVMNEGGQRIKNYKGNYNIPKFSFTAGLEALYQLNEKWSVTLGVQYSDKGGKTKTIQYNPQAIYRSPLVHYRYNYRYIDIPLRIDYYFNKKKIAPFITTGISTNIFVTHSTNYYPVSAPEYTYGETYNFSAVNLQYQLGAGVDIALKHSRLRIFPIYRISIFKPTLGINYTAATIQYLTPRLYSIGLGLSYMIRL